MKKIAILFLAVFAISCSDSNNDIPIVSGVTLDLATYRKAHISNINYQLEFRVPARFGQKIQAFEVLTFNLDIVEQDLQLDFRSSKESVKGVIVNGKTQEVKLINEHLIIDQELLVQGNNSIEINFFAGESSLNRKEEFLYTLFVPDRARTAFPCFDQPNLKATFELTLNLPSEWTAIANAPLQRMDVREGRKNIKYHKSDLISTYLFSFVAGKFQTISRTVEGRAMTMIHRETDSEKVKRNVDFIFYLHNASIKWLEQYTGIKYPFKKFDFALIPSFQYGGMEHVGAIQYRANSLFLDENPSQSRLLSRASLIAHETAHMWFGDLVTMDWFNDVWTKEVFANFMAAKMVNPSFPDIDHDLNFLVRHYPSAYGVDRTSGANPIRQELNNLNEAGQMYGEIIYNKAPIMMRQLEMLIGEDLFQQGIQEYLKAYSFKNATWPNLVSILDRKTKTDLVKWSDVWVNTSGRPNFIVNGPSPKSSNADAFLIQKDPKDLNRKWEQNFKVSNLSTDKNSSQWDIKTDSLLVGQWSLENLYATLFNEDGRGYGLFPASSEIITSYWDQMTDLQKGSSLINLYEQFLEGNSIEAIEYIELFKWLIVKEKNQLLLNRMLGQMNKVYWSFLTNNERNRIAPDLERILFHCMNDLSINPGQKKMFFNAFKNVIISGVNTDRLYRIWDKTEKVQGLSLSEDDFTGLAGQLAIRLPEQSDQIVEKQLANIKNPDRKKRFEFIKPSLSNSIVVRDAFFESLKSEENRQTESWVLGALGYLHHPLRKE